MELKAALKHRNLWLGIAMVGIVFYHSGFVFSIPVLNILKNLCYGGVDICLFASGIGCYYSLDKDANSLRFLKRRVQRLAPAYFCFILPWLAWKILFSSIPPKAILGNLLGIQTLVSWDYHFNWYIGGLWIFYLSLPYLKQITDSCRSFWQDILVTVFLFAIGIPFWDSGNTIVFLARMPVLYAGVIFGKLSRQGYVLQKRDVLVSGLMYVSGAAAIFFFQKFFPQYLWGKGMCWYPLVLTTPGFCLALSALAERMETNRCLNGIVRFFATVGVYSFEVYLVHDFLYEGLMPGIQNRISGIPHNLLWLLTVPFVVCGTYVLNRIAAFVSKTVSKISL